MALALAGQGRKTRIPPSLIPNRLLEVDGYGLDLPVATRRLPPVATDPKIRGLTALALQPACAKDRDMLPDIVIAAAQTVSRRGDLAHNVAVHVAWARKAAALGVDLLLFSELSLTGYELDLADSMQLSMDDVALDALAAAAKGYGRKRGMHIVAGAPWKSGLSRPYLGAFIWKPEGTAGYAKIHVHESESASFAAGRDFCVMPVRGIQAGLAICADASHASHAGEVAARGAQLYLASVMKTTAGYPALATTLRQYALDHRMGVLLANSVGCNGGRVSAGRSAFWDDEGELVVQASAEDEALVIVRRSGGKWQGEIVSDMSGDELP